jgi:hypothetical protein
VFGWASRRVAIWLSLFVVALWVAALPLAAWVDQLNGGLVSYLLLLVPFTVVGALLAVRVPANPIGWIFLLVSLGLLLGQDAASYSVRAYLIDGHGLPLSRLAVAVATGWVAFALLPLPILLFPDGRVSGRGWRWTLRVYLAVAAIAVGGVGVHDLGAFSDAQIHVDSSGELTGGTPPIFVKALSAVALAILAIIAGAWVVRLLRRYRSATGDLREQLKWLISGGGLCIFGFVISILLNKAHGEPWYAVAQAAPFSVVALPLSIGVGVLKYRLYEIDRLISRTLSYALLTAVLAGVFVGVVLLMTRVLPFSSPVAVAASTLAAAALFTPLRARLQRAIEHRFNRARYDAEVILAGFSGRLRQTVDLATIEEELLAAVDVSLAPGHAALWIKPPA